LLRNGAIAERCRRYATNDSFVTANLLHTISLQV
jgi:hypothetical protein